MGLTSKICTGQVRRLALGRGVGRGSQMVTRPAYGGELLRDDHLP